MPGLRETYICSSEDRRHYNNIRSNNDYYFHRYCMPSPPIHKKEKPIYIIDNTESTSGNTIISQEQIKQLINENIAQLKDAIIQEISNALNIQITNEDINAVINEIYGGSASDVFKEE